MLKALYEYGIRNGLSTPPGFVRKSIRAYICLSGSGDYLGVEKCEGESLICPDIGTMANSPDKCNPLAEKAGIVIWGDGAKAEYFRSLLREGENDAPVLSVCLRVLESSEITAHIRNDADARKIKPIDRISFLVDGKPAAADDAVRNWWTEYRAEHIKGEKKGSGMARCLITGEVTEPLDTVPKVNGLQRVGGHSAGEALFCFDKSAFRSYGLKQSANAPVSEEAFVVVKDALDDLLAGAPAMYRRDRSRSFNPFAPVFAGMKFVHWYDSEIEPEYDVFLPVFGGIGRNDDEDDADDEPPSETDTEEQRIAADRKARADADRLVASVRTGERVLPLVGEYHILLVSGNNGRAMVRRYEHGSYETLANNLEMWNDDISLTNSIGTGTIRPTGLNFRLMTLAKYQKNVRDSEQMKKELAGITPAIVSAITNGTPLPDAVASRSLKYIKSRLVSPDENDRFAHMPDGISCQWLKAWANRKRRMRKEEALIMPYYDKNFPSAAYHCGALMAIYADIQRTVMPDVKSGIVDRYYTSASTTPALVLGRLEMIEKHHIAKIEWGALARFFESSLNEVYSCLGEDLPKVLDLEEQTYFAIGYRQMCARIIVEKEKLKTERKEEK